MISLPSTKPILPLDWIKRPAMESRKRQVEANYVFFLFLFLLLCLRDLSVIRWQKRGQISCLKLSKFSFFALQSQISTWLAFCVYKSSLLKMSSRGCQSKFHLAFKKQKNIKRVLGQGMFTS